MHWVAGSHGDAVGKGSRHHGLWYRPRVWVMMGVIAAVVAGVIAGRAVVSHALAASGVISKVVASIVELQSASPSAVVLLAIGTQVVVSAMHVTNRLRLHVNLGRTAGTALSALNNRPRVLS